MKIGQPSCPGAVRDPWDYTLEPLPVRMSRRRAYRGFTEVWTGQKGLASVYFYHLVG